SAGITVTQYSLLRNLSGEGVCSVSALALRVGLERSTLVRNLKPLSAKGYISDGALLRSRSRSLCVTAAGKMLLKKILPLWETAQRGVREKLGIRGTAALLRLLSALEEL
ncbi:MAG: MarR family winged helix-turn-helix transcriptional regulator, partial [Spirochaetales bacterium]|nr:MarR family winged helix-turn-helix transcriptional regulator [Spirochaetales bacterium]